MLFHRKRRHFLLSALTFETIEVAFERFRFLTQENSSSQLHLAINSQIIIMTAVNKKKAWLMHF